MVTPMPQGSPQLGETWELANPVAGAAEQAVIVEMRPESITLLSQRTGRRVAVPDRSFRLTWQFTRASQPRSCEHEDCQARAVINAPNPLTGGSQWVCADHIGRLETGPGRCPSCGMNEPEAPEEGEEGLLIHECGRCHRQWVVEIGQGETTDGLVLGEHIADIVEHFEAGGEFIVRCRLGRTALANLRRSVGNLGNDVDNPQFMGVQLTADDAFGSNNAVLIAYPANEVRNVQSLGGGSARIVGGGLATDPEQPRIGSRWQRDIQDVAAERTYTEIVIVTDVRTDMTTGIMVAFETEGGDNSNTRSLREFLQDYEPEAQRLVFGHHKRPSDPENPALNETWWDTESRKPITIVRLEKGRVRFRMDSGRPASMAKVDFLKLYKPHPIAPECKPGEEYEDTKGIVVTVTDLNDTDCIVSVEGKDGGTFVIAYWEFDDRYKKIARKTTYERLMEDDL